MTGFIKPFRDPLWKRILDSLIRRKRLRCRNRVPMKPKIRIYYIEGRRNDKQFK